MFYTPVVGPSLALYVAMRWPVSAPLCVVAAVTTLFFRGEMLEATFERPAWAGAPPAAGMALVQPAPVRLEPALTLAPAPVVADPAPQAVRPALVAEQPASVAAPAVRRKVQPTVSVAMGTADPTRVMGGPPSARPAPAVPRDPTDFHPAIEPPLPAPVLLPVAPDDLQAVQE